MLNKLKKELKKSSNPKQAELLQRFFKTGRGEYGEGDVFLGAKVPQVRAIVKQHWKETKLGDCLKLMKSKLHEERLLGLLILIKRYENNLEERKDIFKLYLENTDKINNWDLVDLSAPNIFGRHLYEYGGNQPGLRGLFENLANSTHLWTKRIAIIGTAYFIKNEDFSYTLKLAKILLNDSHDLIHKAVGWMLREVGKKDQQALENFLKENSRYKQMPRTMLRYSIERFPEDLRKKYLKGKI